MNVEQRHCLFVPGMTATNAAMTAELGIKSGLAKAYGGSENVTVFNSIVSTDEPNPERFNHMADVVMSHAKSGIDVVAHSLGSEELRRVLCARRRHRCRGHPAQRGRQRPRVGHRADRQ